jgi:PAS domain S-box-containing protein
MGSRLAVDAGFGVRRLEGRVGVPSLGHLPPVIYARRSQPAWPGAASMDTDDRLEVFFSQSLDGFFFMMLDQPVRWDEGTDKESLLDYVFEHQRITKVNDAMLAQYGLSREQFLGLTPKDLYQHDLAYGRRVWREFFDRGRLHVETDERRFDGTPIKIEGDYLCFYDTEGRITGHFGIQRDVTERKRAEDTLRLLNRRLQAFHDTHLGILGSRSAQGIAEATVEHIRHLIPCRAATVTMFDAATGRATPIAAHGETSIAAGDGLGARDAEALLARSIDARPVPESSDSGASAAAVAMHPVVVDGDRPRIEMPLVAATELIGSLRIEGASGRVFGAEDVQIAEELASTLAIAMQQAQLRERVEQHAAELEARVAARTAELQRSESRLSAVVSALPDLVFVIDEDGRYVEIVTSKDHLLNRTPEQLKGRRFHEVLPSATADAFMAVVRRTLETRATQVLAYALHVAAGDRWFEGRTGYLPLPLDGKRCVVFMARDITEQKRAEELESQNVYLQEELRVERSFGDIVGSAPSMQRVFRSIEMVAATDSTALILGETGTGKELIARAIHRLSKRRQAVLVKVNCGALPAGLAESELFGHERGAFTGAVQQKKGRFELANHGTIFLDEVGELSADVQVKLLRVLQEQEIERLGSTQTIRVTVRVIAATNRDLHEQVQHGAFRADLFYRLNVFPIRVPPLRERTEDVPVLASHFVNDFARRMGKSVSQIEAGAMARLTAYDWPGNVRELANVLERAVILCQGDTIRHEHVGALSRTTTAGDHFLSLEAMERQHIVRALEKTGGVLGGPQGAARLLGMSRSTVWSRMRKLGIQPPKT